MIILYQDKLSIIKQITLKDGSVIFTKHSINKNSKEETLLNTYGESRRDKINSIIRNYQNKT